MSHFISKTAFSHLRSSGFSHLRLPPISGGRIGVRANHSGDDLDRFYEPDDSQAKKRPGLDQIQSPNKQQKTMPVSGLRTWKRKPRILKEGEAEYKLRFDMPGMTKEDVKVWVEEKKMLDANEDRPAKSYGRYISIALPEDVEFEKIKVEFKDGVLDITIPKAYHYC